VGAAVVVARGVVVIDAVVVGRGVVVTDAVVVGRGVLVGAAVVVGRGVVVDTTARHKQGISALLPGFAVGPETSAPKTAAPKTAAQDCLQQRFSQRQPQWWSGTRRRRR
jgi:ADP-glucose pyrophosphorylase